jgi:hypothetical protein
VGAAPEQPVAPQLVGLRIRQGDLAEHLVEVVPTPVADGDEQPFDQIEHDRVLFITQDCDLERDFDARTDGTPPQLSWIAALVVRLTDEFLASVQGSEVKRMIRTNQHQRYHCFGPKTGETDAPRFIADFRRVANFSAAIIFAKTSVGGFPRESGVTDGDLWDLMQRYHAYASRVAL